MIASGRRRVPVRWGLSALLSFALAIVGCIAVGLSRPEPAAASHNRASQLEWTSVSANGKVEFTASFVARRSYYPFITEEGQTFNDPTLDFGDGAEATPEFTVLDIDEQRDVLYARAANVIHEYAGNGPYRASLSSCCRLGSPAHLNNPDGSYFVSTLVDPRRSSGSPIASVSPVVNCRTDDVCYFRVTASDPAGRQLRWRLATDADTGGGFAQPGPPTASNPASIDPTSGLYRWDTRGAALNPEGESYYSTQVVVEEVSGADVTSSVAVDFFIRLTTEGAIVCTDTDGNGNPDNDGDALCDNWEDTGVPVPGAPGQVLALYDVNGDGTVDASERSDKNVPDIYVEVDWMAGRKPSADALKNVAYVFSHPNKNSRRAKVRLHVATAPDPIPHSSYITMDGCSGPCPPDTAEFDELKEHYFGTPTERANKSTGAKALAFHYAVFADAQRNGASGVAEIRGNDLIISLGGFDNTIDQQQGTFMHELGHNLGLLHGGGDNVGCKPNYVSVMNYTRQFASWFSTGRALDYSGAKYTTLDEGSLAEADGVLNGPYNTKVAYGNGKKWATVPARGPIDWNFSRGFFGDGIDQGRVRADLNTVISGRSTVCAASDQPYRQLVGYDDWANLVYDFRAGNDFDEGVHSTVADLDEVTTTDVAAVATSDLDGDGVTDLRDNCAELSNPDQRDADGSGFGDVCEPADPTVDEVSRSIVGDPLVGHTLTAPALAQLPAGAVVRYQWYAAGKAIPGATSNSYRPTRADVPKRLTVETTVMVNQGSTTSLSDPTGPVKFGSSTKVTASSSSSTRAVRIVAKVTFVDLFPRAADGTVTLNEDGVALGTRTLNSAGQATFDLKAPSSGRHEYEVAYAGSTRVAASTGTVTIVAR